MRRRSLRLAGVLLFAAAAIWALATRRSGNEPVRATLTVAGLLGAGDTAGFERAVAPRAFHFPQDHGPHPAFRNEWWYFTGNLVGPDARRFGYELTFFRSALKAEGDSGTAGQRATAGATSAAGAASASGLTSASAAPGRSTSSEWRTREVYMAHFAITDVSGMRFLARDRFERGAVGLAGATSPLEGWRVWVGDWRVTADAARVRRGDAARPGASVLPPFPSVSGSSGSGGARGRPVAVSPRPRVTVSAFWPIHLSARDSGMALELLLGEGKAPVLQGENGLSRKGPEPGNASYYYSLTRMPTSGWLEVGGRRYRVAGDSWMDREWSTSALGPDEVGWDWFALQLSDGRELMLYRIRRRDGGISPFSAGTVVERDGRARALPAAAVRVEVLDTWASPRDGARYPSHWRVRVPSAGLDLDVRPVLADQELNLAVRYWEGAVDVRGPGTLKGRGYVELTGYGGAGSGGETPAGRGR